MIELIVSPDLYEINETFRNLDSKFVDGKMMADGPSKRFDNASAKVQVLGTATMAEDNTEINKFFKLKHIVRNLNECPALMKTKEQRQAELELVLQGV